MTALRELLKSWWMFIFFLGCGMALESALGTQREEFAKLNEQWGLLQQEKDKLLQEQSDLKLQVNSQSDPAWVELTLKRKLGLVPEGQKKVFFN